MSTQKFFAPRVTRTLWTDTTLNVLMAAALVLSTCWWLWVEIHGVRGRV